MSETTVRYWWLNTYLIDIVKVRDRRHNLVQGGPSQVPKGNERTCPRVCIDVTRRVRHLLPIPPPFRTVQSCHLHQRWISRRRTTSKWETKPKMGLSNSLCPMHLRLSHFFSPAHHPSPAHPRANARRMPQRARP